MIDHGKWAVTRVPIAPGAGCRQNYAPGADISRYKNMERKSGSHLPCAADAAPHWGRWVRPDYPLTPLLVALSIKNRCARIKISIGGMTEIAAPASTRLGLSAARPRSTLSDNVNT